MLLCKLTKTIGKLPNEFADKNPSEHAICFMSVKLFPKNR